MNTKVKELSKILEVKNVHNIVIQEVTIEDLAKLSEDMKKIRKQYETV